MKHTLKSFFILCSLGISTSAFALDENALVNTLPVGLKVEVTQSVLLYAGRAIKNGNKDWKGSWINARSINPSTECALTFDGFDKIKDEPMSFEPGQSGLITQGQEITKYSENMWISVTIFQKKKRSIEVSCSQDGTKTLLMTIGDLNRYLDTVGLRIGDAFAEPALEGVKKIDLD